MDYLVTVLQALEFKYVTTDLLESQDSAALWRLVGDVILLSHNAFRTYPGQSVPCGLIPLTAAALRYPRASIFDSDVDQIPPNELLLFLCFLCDECGIIDRYRVHHCSVPTPPYPSTLAVMPPSPSVSSDSPAPSGPPSSDRCLQLYTKWRRTADQSRSLEKEELLWEQRWENQVPALSPYEAFVVTHSAAFNAHRQAMSDDPGEARLWEWAATLLPSVTDMTASPTDTTNHPSKGQRKADTMPSHTNVLNHASKGQRAADTTVSRVNTVSRASKGQRGADTSASRTSSVNRASKGQRMVSTHNTPVYKNVATLNIGVEEVPRWATAVHAQSADVQYIWTTNRATLDADAKLRVRKTCAPQARRLESALCPVRGAASVSPDVLAEYLRGEQPDPDAWREKWAALLRTCGPLHVTHKPPFLHKGRDKDAHIEDVN